MRSSWLVSLLLVTMVFAGCANTGVPSNVSVPTQISADQLTEASGKALLAAAASAMPDRYGLDLTLSSGSAQLLTLHGVFDNASGDAYAEITGDPTAWPNATQQGGASLAPFLAHGISVYSTRQGSLYYANGTAFVFPPKSQAGPSSNPIPAPEDGPLAEFLHPVNGPFKDVLAQNNVTVKSVKATTFHGKPVIEMQLETTQDGKTITALVDVYPQPARLAHIESALPKDPANPQDPFGGATAIADFSYGTDVKVEPPAKVTRAIGLSYRSDVNAIQGWNGKGTWTFLVSGGVSASDAEAQLKDTSQSSAASSMGFATAPTKWALKLSDGSKTQDGVTLAFDDKDKDGKVGAGDTLTITTADSSADAPIVALRDTVTGTYIVPSAGILAALGVLALAAIATRRRP